MATNSSILAWRIPRTGEPGGLQSTVFLRVGHDWDNLAHTAQYLSSDFKDTHILSNLFQFCHYIYIGKTRGPFPQPNRVLPILGAHVHGVSKSQKQLRSWTKPILSTYISSWAISNPERWGCESATLNLPENLENWTVATGLEKVSFHSNPKERQCQRMLKLLHNCTHLTC